MIDAFFVRNILAPKKKTLLLGIFCWFMFEIGFGLILSLLFDLNTAHGQYWWQISIFCACFLLTAACFLPFLKESLKYTDLRRLPKELLIGYGVNWGISYAVGILLAIVQTFVQQETVNLNQEGIVALTNFNLLPMLVCTCLLVPVTEECLVRGMIFAPICRKNPLLAYVVSSLIFSVLHVIASIGEISVYNVFENILTYIPSSVALGWIYQRCGTIVAPIALHCAMNMIAMLAIILG